MATGHRGGLRTALSMALALILATVALPASAATFVYVGCTDSNEIQVLRLDPKTGDLAEVEKVTIPGIVKTAGSTPMAISPDKKFLFAATRGEPMVAASFRIDPATGRLSHVANGPLDGSMAYITTDRTGRYLLAAFPLFAWGGLWLAGKPVRTRRCVLIASGLLLLAWSSAERAASSLGIGLPRCSHALSFHTRFSTLAWALC